MESSAVLAYKTNLSRKTMIKQCNVMMKMKEINMIKEGEGGHN